jgi:hypothetical protein
VPAHRRSDLTSIKSERATACSARDMGPTLIGFLLGAVIGAFTGTQLGAYAGAMLGMLVGGSIWGLGWLRRHLGDQPTVERHRVVCTPFGAIAEAEVVGDLGTGRWHDVRSCSLLRSERGVDCEKRCIYRLEHAGVRPGRGPSLP